MSDHLTTDRPWRERWMPNNEWALVALLAIETILFAITGDNFLTPGNVFEIVRLAVSYGLIAFGMTYVIKTGGIDLSVGSTVALVAVVTGFLWDAVGINIWVASVVGVCVGAACGALNGVIITRLKVMPLIVTLATMSLYKGLADAITGGYTAYTGFDDSFLYLGRGYIAGVVPAQLPLFAVIFAALWVLMHRMRFGRAVTAIGFGEAGARYAGIRTSGALLRVYALSGLLAGLAAIVFIAKLGQAKSDAGTGYELTAIAMTVLGGTAITGGRGTLHGTLLGLFVIVVLQNGLRLSGQPSDVANMLIGAILIAAILANRAWRARLASPTGEAAASAPAEGELDMKNNQLAILCGTIIVGALIVAFSNAQVSRALREGHHGAGAGGGERISVGLLPKTKTDPYFISCREGANAAANELGVDILWDGPTKADPEKQNEIVEAWITKGVDVICASVENRDAIDGVLKKARASGIHVLTWDAESHADAREYFVNQATSKGIGYALADELTKLCGGGGEYVIISATTTAANQNEWIEFIKERMASAHPGMDLKEIRYSDGERDKALQETRNALNKYPNLKGVMAIAAPALPGAAEGLKQAGRTDVKLTGLSTPNLCRDYVHEGYIDSVILWNTVDLGYLTVHAAAALHDGRLADGTMDFGRLKGIRVGEGNVYLGEPFVFTEGNIEQFQF